MDFNQIIDKVNIFLSQDFQNFIFHPQFSGWLLTVKMVFIIISFIFAGLIIWLLTASSWLKRAYIENAKEYKQFKPFDQSVNLKALKKIVDRLKTEKEVEYKLAVMETDEFFDKILKTLDYSGKNMEDRFKQLTTEVLPNLDDIKTVHNTRNKIVNDRGYKLTLEETKKVITTYEQGLRHLGAI